MNTIAVDAMGGDSAPEEIVKGAIKAKNLGIDIILCGDKNLIEPFFTRFSNSSSSLSRGNIYGR